MFKLAGTRWLLCALIAPTLASGVLAATQDDELRVDPTVPLSQLYAPGSSGDSSILDIFSALTSYELSSVLIRAEDRIAVVNNQRVRVGDRVGAAVVASIDADQVTLNVDGAVQTLKLYENSIKTRSQVTVDE